MTRPAKTALLVVAILVAALVVGQLAYRGGVFVGSH